MSINLVNGELGERHGPCQDSVVTCMASSCVTCYLSSLLILLVYKLSFCILIWLIDPGCVWKMKEVENSLLNVLGQGCSPDDEARSLGRASVGDIGTNDCRMLTLDCCWPTGSDGIIPWLLRDGSSEHWHPHLSHDLGWLENAAILPGTTKPWSPRLSKARLPT
jgi:hypothetical protein